MMLRLFLTAVALLMAACAVTETPSAQVLTPEATEVVPTVAPTVPTTGSPTAEPTIEQTVTLNIWFPEQLVPIDNEDAADLLSEQISAFQNANANVEISFRLKSTADVGGIMSTLRSANAVAPGAVPDLTLLRRADLLTAVQLGLIEPITEGRAAAVLGNLPPSVAALGRVDDRLYGLPYNVEVQHLALQADDVPGNALSFNDILDEEISFVFPAGRTNTLSDLFLAQYRSAAGLLDAEGLTIEVEALRDTLDFYEGAVNAELIAPIVLEYTTSENYAEALAQGTVNAGVVTSSQYLDLLSRDVELDYAAIPTQSGDPATIIDGWVWVLTTADAEQQTAAFRFLNWMLDANRQSEYNRAIHMLPSQRTALRLWEDAEYVAFIDSLLNQATLPLLDGDSATAGRVIQSAFASVLSGRRTAAQATQDILTQLAG